jgi:glycolate oxidase FAD binding subunit
LVKQAVLHNELESILGPERVFAHDEASSYAVDGMVPQAVALPSTVEEVAEVMRLAYRERAAVIPWGGGTGMSVGNLPQRYDIALSLTRLNAVVEHEPADLTATVLAGKTLADFQDHLSSAGQFLPLDPPSPAEATIGGIVATNAAGPSRHAHGTARDLVLGLRFVQADGRVIKAGGKVVKNVAGYDMCRLFIGSMGTLGVIVEACFRLTPAPKTQLTLAVAVASAQEAYRLTGRAAGLSLRAVELLNAAAARQVDGLPPVPEDGFVLLLAASGSAEAVQRTREGVAALANPTVIEAASAGLWQEVGRLAQPPADGIATRFSVLPSRAPELIEQVETIGLAMARPPRIACHLTTGIVHNAWPPPPSAEAESAGRAGEGPEADLRLVTSLRQAVTSLGGTMIVEAAPAALKEALDVWGEPGADFPLMRSLKEQFDPQGILSPGRFLGRL